MPRSQGWVKFHVIHWITPNPSSNQVGFIEDRVYDTSFPSLIAPFRTHLLAKRVDVTVCNIYVCLHCCTDTSVQFLLCKILERLYTSSSDTRESPTYNHFAKSNADPPLYFTHSHSSQGYIKQCPLSRSHRPWPQKLQSPRPQKPKGPAPSYMRP